VEDLRAVFENDFTPPDPPEKEALDEDAVDEEEEEEEEEEEGEKEEDKPPILFGFEKDAEDDADVDDPPNLELTPTLFGERGVFFVSEPPLPPEAAGEDEADGGKSFQVGFPPPVADAEAGLGPPGFGPGLISTGAAAKDGERDAAVAATGSSKFVFVEPTTGEDNLLLEKEPPLPPAIVIGLFVFEDETDAEDEVGADDVETVFAALAGADPDVVVVVICEDAD
jgi:hypothetical protein